MANLWRILALSWLGGVASPALLDDAWAMERLQPPAATAPASAVVSALSIETKREVNPGAPGASRAPPAA